MICSCQDPVIHLLIRYHDVGAYGLDAPEKVIREVFIMQPDLSPVVGWETGRSSEPAFMDMNLRSSREKSLPSVCVMQWDLLDPLNSAGLLIAYEEQGKVLPVVSDFDTFTVGHTGPFEYKETISDTQADLIRWSLKHCEAILAKQAQHPAKPVSWTQEWLQILTKEAYRGFKPKIPELGFGDPTSVELIRDMAHRTSECGAIRHGAECFNFYFPQELDEEFLIVWNGFEPKHGAAWQHHSESELRQFLLNRIADGYLFPIHPIWPVRDKGWYEVFMALRNAPGASTVLPIWYPGGLIEIIDRIHASYPDGFNNSEARILQAEEVTQPDNILQRLPSVEETVNDLTGDEIISFGLHEAEKAAKARWRRLRMCVKFCGLGSSRSVGVFAVCVGVEQLNPKAPVVDLLL